MKYESTRRQPELPEVFWLEQCESQVPVDNSWLSTEEEQVLARFRFPKRSADWRLGRWTAKQAVSAYLHLPAVEQALSRIRICAAADGAPEACLDEPRQVSISISHREGIAMCVVAGPETALGCDLEVIERRSEAFVRDYFQENECRLIQNADESKQALLANLFWSAKESALKALRLGLRGDPRFLNVALASNCFEHSSDKWRRLRIEDVEGDTFEGWWRADDRVISTVITTPAAEMPIFLEL